MEAGVRGSDEAGSAILDYSGQTRARDGYLRLEERRTVNTTGLKDGQVAQMLES